MTAAYSFIVLYTDAHGFRHETILSFDDTEFTLEEAEKRAWMMPIVTTGISENVVREAIIESVTPLEKL